MPEIILSYWSPLGMLLSFEAFSSSWTFFSVAAMVGGGDLLWFWDGSLQGIQTPPPVIGHRNLNKYSRLHYVHAVYLRLAPSSGGDVKCFYLFRKYSQLVVQAGVTADPACSPGPGQMSYPCKTYTRQGLPISWRSEEEIRVLFLQAFGTRLNNHVISCGHH